MEENANSKKNVNNWFNLFNHFIQFEIYNFKNKADFIVSNHLRINLKQIENEINSCNNETIIPNWIKNNMIGTKITPRTADFVEENFCRKKAINLIKKYDF